jgi:hypothetical protein
MVGTVHAPRSAHRRIAAAALAIGLTGALGGCGSTVAVKPAAHLSDIADQAAADVPAGCPETVLATVGTVLAKVYREGVASERTLSAEHLIAGSTALRRAVESGDAPAATAAAHALLASGHMTNLRVTRGSKTLVNLGGAALAPISGTIRSAGGAPLASYLTSVWADSGFVSEADGVAQGQVAIRSHDHSVGGSLALASGPLPNEGALTRNHVVYQFTSFPAEAYPSGSVRIYALIPLSATATLCGASSEDTLVNTLARVANLIYEAEAGPRTLAQIQRVQRDPALLSAVARRDPAEAKAAVEALLHQHLVRLRVIAGGHLLADVGGPYVLAPVSAPLRLAGHKIGSIVLSIQDDEGYKRLTGRLAGLDVLMYMNLSPAHPTLVKNSLGPNPGQVPASGPYQYRGRSFQVFTVNAKAFPSGPLTIRVLVPIPYS